MRFLSKCSANEKDLIDVPDTAKQGMTFVFVKTVNDILPAAFNSKSGRNQPASRRRKKTSRRRAK